MICRPAHWQRFDTVHSAAAESGQLHAGRQTRFTLHDEDKNGVTASQPETHTAAGRSLADA